MDLSPNDIRNYEFPSQMRGYDKDEVDSLLEQIAAAMEEIADMIEMAKEQIEKTSWGKGQGSALESTTVNVGLVQGGTKVNVIPRSCELEIDIRIPFGATVQDFQSRIDEIFGNLCFS